MDAQVAFGRAMAGGRPIMVADNYSDEAAAGGLREDPEEMDGAPEELNFLGNVAVVEVEAGVHAADLRAVQECSGFANGRAAVREAEGDLGDVSLDAVGFEWHVDGSGVDSSTGRHRPISMLYCLEAPDAGGETLYLSGYHALEQLDAATRALAEQLTVHYGVETGGIRDAAEAAGVLDGSSMEHFRRYGDRMMPDGTRITNVPAAVVESGVRPTHTNPLVKCHPETLPDRGRCGHSCPPTPPCIVP